MAPDSVVNADPGEIDGRQARSSWLGTTTARPSGRLQQPEDRPLGGPAELVGVGVLRRDDGVIVVPCS